MRWFIVGFLAFTGLVQGQVEVKEKKDSAQPLPETRTITVAAEVDDLFGKIYFSQNSDLQGNPKFVVARDPIVAELALMDRFIEKLQKGTIDPKAGYLVVTRYHMADGRVRDRMKKAAELGAAVDFISDFNDSVDVKFLPGEKMVSDFSLSRVTPNKGLNGKMLQEFLDMGFQYGQANQFPRLGLYSQPVFNKFDDNGKPRNQMFDIMHEKSIVAAHVSEGKVLWVQATSGSANMVAHTGEGGVTRVNLVREITNPELAQVRFHHAQALRKNFAQGKAIKDLPAEPLFRVETKNGFVETGFTNGRYNLNDRIAAMMLLATPGVTKEIVAKGFDKGVESYYNRMEAEFSGWKIALIKEMEFVNTHTESRVAEKLLFENDDNVKKLGLYDAKFSTPTGYGFPPIQVGVDLMRPMGGTIAAYSRKISDRMKTMIYQRALPGVVEEDLEGPPISRYLLHTKTKMLRGTLKNGKAITVVFDGSLNNSNHEENAEDQDMIVVAGSSPLIDGYWAIPEALLLSDRDYFYQGAQQLVYDGVARLTGRSPLQLVQEHEEEARKFWKSLVSGDLDTSRTAISKIAVKKPKLKDPIGPTEAKKRIANLFSYLKWHKETFPKSYGKDDYYLRKHLNVIAILSNPKMPSGQVAGALVFMHWQPGVTRPQQEEWAREAWKRLGFSAEFPERKPEGTTPNP